MILGPLKRRRVSRTKQPFVLNDISFSGVDDGGVTDD
jgi:hypothetical protein